MRTTSTVSCDVFPAAGTRALLDEGHGQPQSLTIDGPDLRVSFHTTTAADPDFLAFLRSLRDAADRLVSAYEADKAT